MASVLFQFTFLFICISQALGGFTPPGEFDLGPDDLDKLCPMVKSLAETGKVEEGGEGEGGEGEGENVCVWFEWVSCEDPGDPNVPCGWYEQKECPPERKRRELLRNSSRFAINDESDSTFKTKRETRTNDEPYFLAFPDEHHDLKYTAK